MRNACLLTFFPFFNTIVESCSIVKTIMSIAFIPSQKGKPSPAPTPDLIPKMLNENTHLMQAIVDYQNKGKAAECHQYMQVLHRNLVFLASIADAVPSLLPPTSQPVLPTQVQQVTPLSADKDQQAQTNPGLMDDFRLQL